MKRFVTIVAIIMLALLFWASDRCAKWTRNAFNQGETHDYLTGLVRDYLRSVRVYDQFSTRALLDMLLLDEPVRRAFVRARSCKQHLTLAQEGLLLEHQLEEERAYVTLYVFAPFAPDARSQLNSAQSRWSLVLIIDDEYFQPHDITPIELGPEYAASVSPHCLRARSVYQVRFAVPKRQQTDMTVIISGATWKAHAQWQFDMHGTIRTPVLKRRASLAYDLY